MPQWAGFLSVAALLTALLLVLARQSQQAFDEQATARGRAEQTSDTATDSTSEAISRDPTVEGEPAADELTERVVGDERPGGAGTRSPVEPDNSAETVEFSTGVLLANVAFTQGAVAAVVVVAGWYFSIPASAFGVTSGSLSVGVLGVAAGLGFGIALWLANESSTAVADAVGATYDESVRQLLAPATGWGWVLLLGFVLPLIALSEELLFRAALIGVPEAAGLGVSPWLLAVVASFAFALGHGAQGRAGVVVTGSLGFVLAAGYIFTGSLLVVVVAHYAVNALEFGVHELFGVDPV